MYVSAVDPDLLRGFAAELKAFHIASGEPSYAVLSRLADKHGESLSPASISDLLAGRRLTSSTIALAFVRNVLRYRGNHDDTAHEAEVDRWLERWTRVRNSTNPASLAGDAAAGPTAATPPLPVELDFTSIEESTVTRHRRRPPIAALLPPGVRIFHAMLDEALSAKDPRGRRWSEAKWGCYAFYDFDGEPIYVGQTNEGLRVRVRRHLSNQRTDAVAMRVLDVMEVAELELWPLWELEDAGRPDHREAQKLLGRVECTVYRNALEQNSIGMLLNTHIPPSSEPVTLPESARFPLVDPTVREMRGAPDVRIARCAETLARLAGVVAERGGVSASLRRVMVVQAARLTRLTAARHAYAAGELPPEPNLVDIGYLRAAGRD